MLFSGVPPGPEMLGGERRPQTPRPPAARSPPTSSQTHRLPPAREEKFSLSSQWPVPAHGGRRHPRDRSLRARVGWVPGWGVGKRCARSEHLPSACGAASMGPRQRPPGGPLGHTKSGPDSPHSPPSPSFHGWDRAVDIAGILERRGWGSPRHQGVKERASKNSSQRGWEAAESQGAASPTQAPLSHQPSLQNTTTSKIRGNLRLQQQSITS